MIIDIITLFPEMFAGVFEYSIVKRACENKVMRIDIHNLRDWASDKHRTVDDTPYGGGAGMLMKVDVMDRCLSSLLSFSTESPQGVSDRVSRKNKKQKTKTILLTPHGKTFDQAKARELSKIDHLILICGHYEGFDQRIHDHLIDEEVSIGDFVLTGGEIPAMAIVDAVTRLVPGVIKEESHQNESFSLELNELKKQNDNQDLPKKRIKNCLSPIHANKSNNNIHVSSEHEEKVDKELFIEYPQYTKPAEYKGWKVPEVLLSGNHAKIDNWRKTMIRKK